MKKEFLLSGLFILTTMLLVTMSGCTHSHISLVDQGIISVETESSENAKILWSDVYQDKEGIVVYGVIERCGHTTYPLETHLDITVLSMEGKVLQEAQTPDIYLPRRIPGKGINWKRFRVRFPEIPQASTVQLVPHSGIHET